MPRPTPKLALLLVAALLAPGAWATGIFTCIDAQGRRLTSDRSIPECLDREQRELSPSGTVRRVLKPPLTAAEQAAEDERARIEAARHQHEREERLRQRALVTRYPNASIFEGERESALAAFERRIASSQARLAALVVERRRLDGERANYRQASATVPAGLSQAIAQVDAQRAEQERFIADQAAEKARVNARFEAMRRQLEPHWAIRDTSTR